MILEVNKIYMKMVVFVESIYKILVILKGGFNEKVIGIKRR